MATHDYVIANGTGAAVRSDLNDALAAIVSNNSGSSEPATTYAYQWWADTTNNLLKLRNSANNAWITLRELDGTLLMEDGSASSPGLSFASDSDTGFFRGGANELGIATSGTQRMKFTSGEAVVNEVSSDYDFRVESNGNTHMLFVDAGNDRVGIGASAPENNLHVKASSGYAELRLEGASSAGGTLLFYEGSTKRADIFADPSSNIVFRNTNESARIDSSGRLLIGGTNTYHANADDLVVQGTGKVGVTIASTDSDASSIYFADSTSNPGTYACYFEYDHSADALKIGQGNSERIRLDSSGDVGIGTSSPDLKLEVSGGQNQTANTFTDLLRVAANANNDAADAEVQLNFGIQPSHTDAANRVARIQAITGGGDTKNLLINPSGGNVGIGTTSPNGALQVSRGSGNAKIFIHRTNAAANTNDYGSIIWRSNDGNNNGVIATARQSAENDGYMFFSTASGGSLGERLRIQAAGGISFNGDSAAANALDDYEQGTWNPTVAFGGSSSGVAYNEREGIYIKIGNLIWVSMVLSLTSNGTGTGDITISLPYAVGDNSENRAVGNLAYFANFSGLNSNPNVYAPSGGSTTCRLQHLNNSSGSGTQVTTLTHGNVTNSASWRAALMYTTMD